MFVATYHAPCYLATMDYEAAVAVEDMAWWVDKRRWVRPLRSPRNKDGRPKKIGALVASARQQDMIAMFKAGDTLAQIGKSYGISRERVRQILKMFDVAAESGGASVRAFLNVDKLVVTKKNREELLERKIRARWSISMEDYLDIRSRFGYAPFRAYIGQRFSARRRGIVWEFTFMVWWQCWQESGVWNRRGIGFNRYCMARHGDSGAYSPANVYICTNQQNISDSYITKPVGPRIAKRRSRR